MFEVFWNLRHLPKSAVLFSFIICHYFLSTTIWIWIKANDHSRQQSHYLLHPIVLKLTYHALCRAPTCVIQRPAAEVFNFNKGVIQKTLATATDATRFFCGIGQNARLLTYSFILLKITHTFINFGFLFSPWKFWSFHDDYGQNFDHLVSLGNFKISHNDFRARIF